LKTPTAVADFILDIFMQEDARLSSLFQRISLALSIKINIEEQGLKRFSDRFKNASTEAIKERERQLETFTLRLNGSNPASILAKGFVIASVNGKHAIEIDDIKEGEKMSLIMRNGIVEFTIGEIINKKINNL
ncbi:MAG: hypothetical protein RR770_02040, partial [Bacteroidales bacterium]